MRERRRELSHGGPADHLCRPPLVRTQWKAYFLAVHTSLRYPNKAGSAGSRLLLAPGRVHRTVEAV